MIDRHGMIFVKPVSKAYRQEGQGRPGRKGPRPQDRAGGKGAAVFRPPPRQRQGQGARRHLRGRVPAEHEVYFSIADSTRFRAPTMTHHAPWRRRHRGARQGRGRHVPFDALTGLKAFVIANALSEIDAPKEDHLAAGPAPAEAVGAVPRLRHDHARAQPDPDARRYAWPPDAGRLRLQVRLRPRRPALAALGPAGRPVRRRLVRLRDEINQLRTYQGQSDVYVINPQGTILAPTFGGGPTRWSPRSWATTRSSPRTSAATRPTRR